MAAASDPFLSSIGAALTSVTDLHALLASCPPQDANARAEALLQGALHALRRLESEGSKAGGAVSREMLEHLSNPRGAGASSGGGGSNPSLLLQRHLLSAASQAAHWDARGQAVGALAAELRSGGGGSGSGSAAAAPPPLPQPAAAPPPPQAAPPRIISAYGLQAPWAALSAPARALPPADDALHAFLLPAHVLEFLRTLPPEPHARASQLLAQRYHGRPCAQLSQADVADFFTCYTQEELSAAAVTSAAREAELAAAIAEANARAAAEASVALAAHGGGGSSGSGSGSSSSSSSIAAAAAPGLWPLPLAPGAPPFAPALAPAAPAAPLPQDILLRGRLLDAAGGGAGALAMAWEAELLASLQGVMGEGYAARAAQCGAEAARRFAQCGLGGALRRLLALRWGGYMGGAANPFDEELTPATMAAWGFEPDYGAAVCVAGGERPMDLKRIAKAAGKSERAGGYGGGEKGLAALVEDVARMARCALIYYGPEPSAGGSAGSASSGSSAGSSAGSNAASAPGAAPPSFPHPSTLPPGLLPRAPARQPRLARR